MFWAQKFFGGQTHKFLDRYYEIEHASGHVAKFCGDWPTDLGDLAMKK